MGAIDVTCAVILSDGRVLATQRSPDMPHPLKWEFPGGKVREGESLESCLVREIREDQRARQKATAPPPYHYVEGFSLEGLPVDWMEDLWVRRN